MNIYRFGNELFVSFAETDLCAVCAWMRPNRIEKYRKEEERKKTKENNRQQDKALIQPVNESEKKANELFEKEEKRSRTVHQNVCRHTIDLGTHSHAQLHAHSLLWPAACFVC